MLLARAGPAGSRGAGEGGGVWEGWGGEGVAIHAHAKRLQEQTDRGPLSPGILTAT